MDSEIYYYVDKTNSQVGPVSIQLLRDLLMKDEISVTTLAWTSGQTNWMTISDMPSLKALLLAKSRSTDSGGSLGKAHRSIPKRLGFGSIPGAPSMKPQKSFFSLSMRHSLEDDWEEKITADGIPYYYNTTSECVSWDKPAALKTAEEKVHDTGEWIWIRDEHEAWLPVAVKTRTSTSVIVTLKAGAKKTINPGPNEPMWPLKPSSLAQLEDDLVMIEDLNQGLMIYVLKERYLHDKIYTWVGASHTVLVSVNPFKLLNIYTPTVMKDFAKSTPNRLAPPHTFAIANSSYNHMRMDGKNQAILISGESGAGKTEATKQCFSFLAEVAGSELGLEQKILNANPILEAFGNAKTLRNDNSSRFGRWTEIHFSPRGQITCASIENYLLEKSRVVYQSPQERNYHIFYQLCECMGNTPALSRGPQYFRYLNQSGCVTVNSVRDEEDFRDVRAAFNQLKFTEDDINWVFETCVGILFLGNINFENDGEGSKVIPSSMDALRQSATFLKVDTDRLAKALCHRSIEVRGEQNKILNSAKGAQEAVDALAKAVYNELFNWLVAKINYSVQGVKGTFIGVLDIFGFEIFEKNSFEQLCINYTNEKLQQHFNANTFKEEEETYILEEIPFDRVLYIDNQPVLELIELRPYGLLVLMDEEVRLPKGDDTKWLIKCNTYHSKHANWMNEAVRMAHLERTSFVIRHYAGEVMYDCEGFCDKNRDNLFRDLYNLMTGAKHPLFAELFPPKDNNPRKVETLGGRFRKQLSDLMTLVHTTQPKYIRCMKPNTFKKPNHFNSVSCLEQLTYAGVFEAVQIRKTGYPFRLLHRQFVCRYRPLLRKEEGWVRVSVDNGNDVAMCRAILSSVRQDFSKVVMGKTMVLYRAEEHRTLELLRNLSLEWILPSCQRTGRKYVGKKYRQAVKSAKSICLSAIAVGNDAELLDNSVERALQVMAPFRFLFSFEVDEIHRARLLRIRLKERVALTVIFKELYPKSAYENYSEFVDAVKRAELIKEVPGTLDDMRIEKVIREKLNSAASTKIDPWADEVLYLLDKSQMEQVLIEADSFGYTTSVIEDIRSKLKLPEEKLVKLQLIRAQELGDPVRVINREIRLKDIFLELYGHQFMLGPRLSFIRDPQDWACAKFYGLSLKKHDLMQNMLNHTLHPIHLSLTKLDKEMNAEAIAAFKNLMGWMGDRKYNYPDTLGQEFVSVGLHGNETLRCELYVQLMKQLSRNPFTLSQSKGWSMMAIMLSSYPPPPTVENIVAMFLKQNAPDNYSDKYLRSMYEVIYGGSRSSVPSLEEMFGLPQEFLCRSHPDKFARDDLLTVTVIADKKKDLPPVIPSLTEAEPVDENSHVTPVSLKENASLNTPTPSPYVLPSPDATTSSYPVRALVFSPEESPIASIAAQGKHRKKLSDMAPPVPPRKQKIVSAIMLYDYVPRPGEDDMIEVRKNTAVTVVDKSDNNWWIVSLVNGQEGYVPASYVSDMVDCPL